MVLRYKLLFIVTNQINWVRGRNATLRPVQKLHKETGKPITKFAKRNSFFNFFTPPKVNTGHQVSRT